MRKTTITSFPPFWRAEKKCIDIGLPRWRGGVTRWLRGDESVAPLSDIAERF
jgi:hypothetical protein